MSNKILETEKFETYKLDCGIQLEFCHKPNYSKKIASIATRFGSIHNKYVSEGSEHVLHDGIAHFLEHKLFEKEDANFLNVFSKYGGSVNAYTTFDHTSYFFTCTENFENNFEMLLKMMTTPYFTEETVEKEKGIINEEIKMYQDNPDAKLFFEILKSLFPSHPVSTEILGDMDTIAEISAEDLHSCFNTFYHPSNLVIMLVGDLDINVAIKQIESYYSNFSTTPSYSYEIIEDISSSRKSHEINMDVNIPKAMLGFKRPYTDSYNYKREVAIDIYMEMLFGKSSDYYEELSQKNIFPEYGYSEVSNIGFASISADVTDEVLFYDVVGDVISKGVDEKRFENYKNKNIGKVIKSFNSVENISRMLVDVLINGCSIEKMIEDIESLTFEDVVKYASETINFDNAVTVTIKPL